MITKIPTQPISNANIAGLLGVAVTTEVLTDNIDRMLHKPDQYFITQPANAVLEHPDMFYGPRRWGEEPMAYFPQDKPEQVEVIVRDGGPHSSMERNAYRSLAYKILKREGTHGTDFKMEQGPGYVRMSAIPIILTQCV